MRSADNCCNLQVYEACVVTKLMYGLHTSWLNKAERRRLDAFNARCIRRIMGVPHSYISRVANADVLARAGARPLSHKLLQQQLLLYSHVARLPDHSAVRQATFENGDVLPKVLAGTRKRGRPRNTWIGEVHRAALQVTTGLPKLREMLLAQDSHGSEFRQAVNEFTNRLATS